MEEVMNFYSKFYDKLTHSSLKVNCWVDEWGYNDLVLMGL